MQSPIYIINGRFSQGISPIDRGFAYGDGVFRTMRLMDGELIDWPLHYQTLVHDCGKVQMVCPSAELLMQDLKSLMQKMTTQYASQASSKESYKQSCTIKVIITRGEGARGYAPPSIATPTRVMIASPLPKYNTEIFEHGVALYVCQTRLGHQPLTAGIKHLNRLENVLARGECTDPAFFDGLLQDIASNVIEATAANVFLRIGNRLITPNLDLCGVAGVMRQKLIWLAPLLGYELEVSSITLERCLQADDVVITNSMFGVLQVNKIGEVSIAQHDLAKQIRARLESQVDHG